VGGLEKNVLLLSRELVGDSNRVIVGASRGTLTEAIEKEGALFVDFNFSLTNIAKLFTDVIRLQRLIKHECPDIIHVFSAKVGVVLFLAKLLSTLRMGSGKKFPPVVSSIMGLQSSPGESYLATQLRNYLVCFAAQRVYIISPVIARFAQKLPLRKGSLQNLNVVGIKLPGSIAANAFELRKQLEISPDDQVVMTIGRLEECKSHELFVESAVKVLKHYPNTTFLIVGVGPLKDRLQSLINKLGVPSKTKLIGLRTDIYELLTLCDVYMKPGVVNGFIGITVLEAQAMAVPVVAWYTEDVTMAIDNGTTGLLVNGTDTTAMADGIRKLLIDKEFAKKIGENGRAFVQKTFAIESISRKLLRAYEKEISCFRDGCDQSNS
jgi:glycosyltransferase involved in cell wall biosynthesis